ncbi:protein argonaute 4 [Solanum pennellii]|uniref:Protein argonaute 4 n=1 Tax=Solanum pennellii TaxID=28526 RepID=A0ABM1H208_SOLPN|nr:protein argonaute 4 [Solanum pennellii]
MAEQEYGGSTEALPPPPPVPLDISPVKAEPAPVEKKLLRVPMARRGLGKKGHNIRILTNHFQVNVSNVDGHFFHYSVALFYENGQPVEVKGIGRKVLDRVHETYHAELAGKRFAYDGEKSLFTIGSLPRSRFEFTVVLNDITSNRNVGTSSPPNEADRKRLRRPYQSKTYKVKISFAGKIPMQAIANAFRGQEYDNSQEALRVLDIILRQHAAKKDCLLVRQSFFHNDSNNFVDVGGGVHGWRGFHSSFRTTQSGLSLNIDMSTTMIIQPGPVLDFLIANQNARNSVSLDWAKAKRVLKNLRVKTATSNQEFKITGLSEKSCREQTFILKRRSKDEDGEVQTSEVTVYDYFVNDRNIDLRYSADLPCLNVGKPKRPTYFPIELCTLVSLQRYTKALSTFQRASLVEKSRQKPQERMQILSHALKLNNYVAEPLLHSCGVSINSDFTQIEGRVLAAPGLKAGNGVDIFAQNGRWNFNNKRFFESAKVEQWAVVNFSTNCDIGELVERLTGLGETKGISVEAPLEVFEEYPQLRRAPPVIRVDKMFEEIHSKLHGAPKFLLCLLPERKNCDIYGPWKRKNLADHGIVTQCLAPAKVNNHYLTNLLLKINAKLGGLNSMLAVEVSRSIPMISKVPTMILGMDVSHGSPGQSEVPSIAAVVSSRQWPSISHYRASVRTQSPKVEIIDNIFKKVSDTRDDGIMRELLLDFHASSQQRKPQQIIVFRDGVSESQFNQVLNIELDQIIEACKFLDEKWSPKFVIIVAQKNHHTKFFQSGSPHNVPPGTIIDNKVCHPRNNDFYLCAHAGTIGTTRPTHYHVLLDEVGFKPDELQELVHNLCYVYQRSTTATSIVAPIGYAHLAAAQVGQWMKSEGTSETSSSQDGLRNAGPVTVPQLPSLQKNVATSMFFC